MRKIKNASSCSCPLCKHDNIKLRLKQVVKGRYWTYLDCSIWVKNKFIKTLY
jgi:hypothetical protein